MKKLKNMFDKNFGRIFMPIKNNEKATSYINFIDAAAMNVYILLKKAGKEKLSKKRFLEI